MKRRPQAQEKPWYTFRAAASDETEVWIYGEIGTSWWGDSVSAKDFAQELSAIETPRIALHINSPGGEVFDGMAIHNAIVRHEAYVTAYIDGLAASMASIVALAADRVVMAENALFMIHKPVGLEWGNADELRKTADILDKIEDTMVGIYDRRSALNEDEIRAAVAEETWYSAEEALDAGFVDEIGVSVETSARFDLEAYGFKHPPTSRRTADDHTPAAGAAPVDEGGAPSPTPGEAFVPGLGYVKF